MKRVRYQAVLLLMLWGSFVSQTQAQYVPPNVGGPSTPLTPQQAQWWNANRHLAQHVPGHGYQIPGVSGYFDEHGRLLANPAVATGRQIHSDDDEGLPMSDSFANSVWRRVTGRDSSSSAAASAGSQPAYTPTGVPGVTPEQARWWAENRRFARPISAGVYQIDGHGIFNEQGRLLGPPGSRSSVTPSNVYSQPTGYSDSNPPFSDNSTPYNTPGSNIGETLANQYSSTDSEDEEESLLKYLPGQGKKKVNQPVARQAFAQAEAAMRAGNFDEALSNYEEAAENWPDSPLEEDAMFMIGECHFFSERFPKAFTAYEELLKKYKRSRHLEKVVLREFEIGQYWVARHDQDPSYPFTPNFTDKRRPRLDTLGQARRAFSRVRLNDPTGKLADDSLMATAGSHFKRGDFDDAAYHYTLLVREYPKSEHQYDAHILGIQSHLRVYQGPEYDKTPLVEAERLMEQALRQFPQQPPEQRRRLEIVRAQITEALAKRDLNTAEFYQNKGFTDGARQYYQEIIRDYPETPIAQQAHQRLAELHGEPGLPPNRFTWISAVFPEQKDEMTDMIRAARAPSQGPVRR